MRPIDADRLKAVLEKNFGHTGGASVLEQLIDEQPTIEPSTNCSEIPNSSDTISRQAVIDALDKRFDNIPMEQTAEILMLRKDLRELPTIQPEPKKGEWSDGYRWQRCSLCKQTGQEIMELLPELRSKNDNINKIKEKRTMKNIKSLIIGAFIIIILGLACAVNTEAATVKYAKSVSDIKSTGEYILEAAEYPKSSTKKVDGWVATPDADGWMNLKKYNASTAKSKHQIWRISNFVWNSYPDGGGYYGDHAPTYTIDNSDPLPYWSNDFMARAVTYTSKGFYRMEEIYGAFSTHYEHFNSPAQRFTIKKVRVDSKTGRTIFKFINVKSGKAMAAGGYALFYVRIVE